MREWKAGSLLPSFLFLFLTPLPLLPPKVTGLPRPSLRVTRLPLPPPSSLFPSRWIHHLLVCVCNGSSWLVLSCPSDLTSFPFPPWPPSPIATSPYCPPRHRPDSIFRLLIYSHAELIGCLDPYSMGRADRPQPFPTALGLSLPDL